MRIIRSLPSCGEGGERTEPEGWHGKSWTYRPDLGDFDAGRFFGFAAPPFAGDRFVRVVR